MSKNIDLSNMIKLISSGQDKKAYDKILEKSDVEACKLLHTMGSKLQGYYYHGEPNKYSDFFEGLIKTLSKNELHKFRRSIFITAIVIQLQHYALYNLVYGTRKLIKNVPCDEGKIIVEILSQISDERKFVILLDICTYNCSKPVLTYLCDLTKDMRSKIRLKVVNILGSLSRKKYFDNVGLFQIILPIIQDEDPYVRLAAADVLFSLDSHKAALNTQLLIDDSFGFVQLKTI